MDNLCVIILTTWGGKTCHAHREASVTGTPVTCYTRRQAIIAERKMTCVERQLLLKFFTESQFLLALHRVKLSVLTPDCKMESDSEASDIICTNKKKKQDNVESDNDLEEIVFPLRNRRRIISDNEEEVQNENRERNVSSQG